MGIFDRKYCSICGDKIGLLGNRKLEDGNLCKNCSAKLSPFFSERRSSTVEEIKEQLAYREDNKAAVTAFHTTRAFGSKAKLLLDEDNRKFVVTRARDLVEENPDVLDYSMVTGVDLDIDENKDEAKRKDNEGKYISYTPPRYTYSYDFDVIIRVNHPYFDTIKLRLNPSAVKINDTPVIETVKPNPNRNRDFVKYETMGKEIKDTLLGARQQIRDEAAAGAAPKAPVRCPYCGATSVPDESGCCEYCGSAIANINLGS